MAAFDPDVRRKLLRVAPKRPSDSGIFESVQGREDFCSADVGFGGSLSDVTNLIGGRAPSEGVRWLWRRAGTGVDGRRPREWRTRMLLTEQDAVMKKWCPMIRLRWESRPLAFNRFQSGPRRPLSQHDVSNLFPAPASRDEGAVPIRAAQRILWLGRHALHVHGVIDRALQGAGPSADISTLFGQRRSDDTT